MAQASNQELTDRFIQFYRNYYRDEIGELAQQYPNEQRSLYIDYDDLYQFDADLAEDYRSQPDQLQEYAEEALRLYDLPADVKLGNAHVRLRNLPEHVDIRGIRVHDNHIGKLISVQGIVRKATDVRPKITDSAFECQRCGTMNYIPQQDGEFQEPHECQGCERQGPFRINFDQSEFVDAQKIRVQESPEGLRGGETPQSIDMNVEDDITGEVTPGDHVTAVGVLHIEQMSDGNEKSSLFDIYMDGVAITIEDEEFENMDIEQEDIEAIMELSEEPDLYERMVGSVAPSIYGYDEEKLAMILQLFSGVTKNLPDGSRIRGDLHMLLIGDPGTGKCVKYDTKVTLADGSERHIEDIVESNLTDPKPVDDGVWDHVDIAVPSLQQDGTLGTSNATKVWKREAPEQLYEITTEPGHSVIVTPSHPLFVQTGTEFTAVRAEELSTCDSIAVSATEQDITTGVETPIAADGGGVVTEQIATIETVESTEDWVYDLEVAGTHNYLTNNVISHNSQMLSYIRNIAPRSVYTSGKGSSSAGLTAAAVRDDFGEGQQWTLEAGALVLADKGIAAVDELDKMRCVTGDTLVHLGDGRIRRIGAVAAEAAEAGKIEELPNGKTIRGTDLTVWTMTDDGSVVRRPVSAIHEYDAPESLTDVTLASGERLTATDDHPFFVREDGDRRERAASDLRPGDWVYVPRSVPAPASDGGTAATPPTAEATASKTSKTASSTTAADGMSPDLGAVLGYLVGDGNVYYNRSEGSYGIRFTNGEESLLADFERACAVAFDGSTTRPPSEQREDGVETVRLHGKQYADAVLDAGLNLETYDEKPFPTGVTTGSRETKAAFVRALADSEGSVDTTAGNVRIHSASEELLVGTKELLLEFDISTQIQHRERAEGRDVYALTITDAESLAAYARHIGFTLDRKRGALDTVVEAASGDRTILDVIPGAGDTLSESREQLRLYQRECGINAATYCEFETETANVSIHRARRILDAFETRRRRAATDIEDLREADRVSWDRLDELKTRYHVTQDELADGTTYSQQQISADWGASDELQRTVRDRLESVIADVAATDLSAFRALVRGDVKWRQVEAVESVSADAVADREPIHRQALADILGGETASVVERARTLLESEPETDSWESLREALERHGVSFADVAADLDVAPSTVSRWFGGVVETDRFPEVRAAAEERIAAVREEVRRLVDAVDAAKTPSVYDLTVEGTHNFIANGMVVHNSEDRSAMHEALEQQQISISKAGINATLKSRCSLLGAANPKYGRFDQYEPIGEQIDLEPALISRFDLIFTVTDEPDPERDGNLADHILTTNYAGELNTQRERIATSEFTQEEVDDVTEEVAPAIEPDLLRKYIAHAKRSCYPTMTDEAKAAIREFYVDLRSKGADEDAPIPVTARKLEALVRLAEASARVRLSDTVEEEDAERSVDIVRSCLQDIGVDPETGQFDADVVETGTSKTQRDRIKNIKGLISDIEEEFDEGAPIAEVLDRADEIGMDASKAEQEIEKLRRKGEVYEPKQDHLRTT